MKPFPAALALGALCVALFHATFASGSPAANTLATVSPTPAGLRIDGIPDEAEWQAAQHITGFKVVQPLTKGDSQHPMEAWLLPTAEGLAVAFHSTQGSDIPRSRQRTQRDQFGSVDRVNLVVDYNGDGGTGYNFTLTLGQGVMDAVVSNENVFRQDWDGDWQHAIAEQPDGWSAEMLIPWHVAPMKRAVAGKRTLGVYFDRVIAATGERVAWPAISYYDPRYLSVLAKVEVPAYSQSLLAMTPYVVSTSRMTGGGTAGDGGADLLWKPSGAFQLTATLNPDFGQIESDELVVNFDAVETFYSDKRPFFTENQGLFDVPFGQNKSGLVYTRRVGAMADDGSGPADVLAALKLNGSLGGTEYGLLSSVERGRGGRDFFAFRAVHNLAHQDLGLLATQVQSSFLERTASVLELDHHWKPNARFSLVTQLVGSMVDTNGTRERDAGFQLRLNHELNTRWRQNLYVLHAGENLQLNDFGYLDRNAINYVRYEMRQRVTALAENSAYRSHDWGYAASSRHNMHGDTIFNAVQVSRTSDTRGGGNEFLALTALSKGYDDRLSRGNGRVRMPGRLLFDITRNWPQKGNWSYNAEVHAGQTGLEGLGSTAVEVFFQPTYHVTDALRFNVGARVSTKPDWLIWRGGSTLANYNSRQFGLVAGVQWAGGSRHELRVKLESIAVDANGRQRFAIQPGGRVVGLADRPRDFALQNLGIQLRYRYELAPLSYLYVVYGRGGLALSDTNGESLGHLMSSAFTLRDSEQILVKFNYRFEI